jgi:hypothetical protein
VPAGTRKSDCKIFSSCPYDDIPEGVFSGFYPHAMKKPIIIIVVLVLSLVSVYYWANRTRTVSKEKAEQIKQFLRTVVVNSLEQDYKRHNMQIAAVVTKLDIDRIASDETREYILYFAQGKVSYIIQGRRDWFDQEGNPIQLGPETEITHTFTCGVREDRYGDLSQDDRKRLSFYADDVTP